LDERSRAVEPRNAFVMSHLLQEVTRAGTAMRAQQVLKRNDIYGKTGTTNDSMDAWFAGYHPTLTAVTWIGYDTPRKLGDRETGGGLSLPVWISYMQSALKNTPITPLPVPAGVVFEGGDWFFQEFTHTTGVTHLGIEGHDATGETSADTEKKKILDMFKE
ncbi:MAG: penicillin-binding protein, partial [Betaproteobacteria bacterium]|nr:penicillin-binding protein [Betaproteobacteria bacterium]